MASARIPVATGKQGTPAGEAAPATAESVRKCYKVTGNEDRNVATIKKKKIGGREKTPQMAMFFFLLGMAVKACRDLASLPAAGDPSTEPLDVCCLGKRVCHLRMGASGCRARYI